MIQIFQEPRRPTRVAVSLGRPFPRSAAAYLWHNKRYLRKIVGDFFHFGECLIIALDYHQVLHIDRGLDPKAVVMPVRLGFIRVGT